MSAKGVLGALQGQLTRLREANKGADTHVVLTFVKDKSLHIMRVGAAGDDMLRFTCRIDGMPGRQVPDRWILQHVSQVNVVFMISNSPAATDVEFE